MGDIYGGGFQAVNNDRPPGRTGCGPRKTGLDCGLFSWTV
jgi:hypothetical protein